MSRHYFAFRVPGDGCHIHAMGELPFDPESAASRAIAKGNAQEMANEKVTSGYYPEIEVVEVVSTYTATVVSTHSNDGSPL